MLFRPACVLVLGLALLSACAPEESPRTFTITANGTHVTVTPNGAVTVTEGATQPFTVTAEANYTLLTTITGDCPAGAWSGGTYTTGAITADCSIGFSAAVTAYTVTPSGTNVTIAPSGLQTIEANKKASFTVTANEGHTLLDEVAGTCPAGTWEGNVYTTGAITEACSVKFAATINTFSVKASGDHVSIAPSGVQTVEFGSTLSFTLTYDPGYDLTLLGGTCPTGSLNGHVYTTGPIKADCTVEFVPKHLSYIVTSLGPNLTIDPADTQFVLYGDPLALKVTPATGYSVSPTVSGSCPQGSWQDDTYTTGAIIEDCSVEFAATLNSYTVTVSGPTVTVDPSGDLTVQHGDMPSWTVAPDASHKLPITVGGTCPAGTWNGDVYTAGAITGPCTVEFDAPPLDTYSVTPYGPKVTTDPSTSTYVLGGSSLSFTVQAESGYTRLDTVGGTCPAGAWSGDTYTTGPITADCTVSFSVDVVYLYNGGAYLGGDIGDRTAAAAKCQQALSNVPQLACTHFVPLLGYAPDGITDLTSAPWSIPSSRKFLGKTGSVFAEDWNGVLNHSNVGASLVDAGVVTNNYDETDIVWTGFAAGGAAAFDCDGWSSESAAIGVKAYPSYTTWATSYGSGCSNVAHSMMCLCWAE